MVNQEIKELSQQTIDRIAAGEVVERPASVVKELCENAIDAGADAITVELKEGGEQMIRVTDNGGGIRSDQIRKAFFRHATSKITDASDLVCITSLGFRGEALSSIAAVSRVEVFTKTQQESAGTHYVIEGGKEQECSSAAAPAGTTIFVRSLFYNTPARRKFQKSSVTEGNLAAEIVNRLALSHPEISFTLISQGRERLATAGSGKTLDAVYRIFGRDIATSLLPVSEQRGRMTIRGFIGKPRINRGNRSHEYFFVDQRSVRSKLLSQALEEGYRGFTMQHQYPFCVLFLDFDDHAVDVNVHPTKQEVRFLNEQEVTQNLCDVVSSVLHQREQIDRISLADPSEETPAFSPAPEPFEKSLRQEYVNQTISVMDQDQEYVRRKELAYPGGDDEKIADDPAFSASAFGMDAPQKMETAPVSYEQESFFAPEEEKQRKIIGQIFDTYWIFEYDNKMYLMDQHAAHEKILYEKTMRRLKEGKLNSQVISPPVIVSLSDEEAQAFSLCRDVFERLGYEVEAFGGSEYALRSVPADFSDVDPKSLFYEVLSDCLSFKSSDPPDLICERVASMSCKAAVKGNMRLTLPEAVSMLNQLFSLDNPYHCPHGRPTMISFQKTEIERMFKRIVS